MLPFVTRQQYARAFRLLRQAHDHSKRLLDELRQRNAAYESLIEKYHALKLQGAAAPEPTAVMPEPEMPPDILMRAIKEVSPRQDEAYRMNYQWAMAQKDHWKDENRMRQCAALIRRGSAPSYDDDTSTTT